MVVPNAALARETMRRYCELRDKGSFNALDAKQSNDLYMVRLGKKGDKQLRQVAGLFWEASRSLLRVNTASFNLLEREIVKLSTVNNNEINAEIQVQYGKGWEMMVNTIQPGIDNGAPRTESSPTMNTTVSRTYKKTSKQKSRRFTGSA